MKISILVITYNHAPYIRRALESLLMQREISDYELLICDDCSSDETVPIMREQLASSGKASFHVNEKNLGITKNYQQAFSRCKGEYIFILEGDDYWIDPYKIKKQVLFLDEHPVCAMCSHLFIVQKDNLPIFDFPETTAKQPYILFDGKDLILDEGIISNFSTCCYRRSMLEKISERTYGTISYEWMINISISEHGFLARLNESMSVYRHSANGTWSKIPPVEQLQGMHDILPVYDEILGGRLHHFFKKKTEMLYDRIKIISQPPGQIKKQSLFHRAYHFIKRKATN